MVLIALCFSVEFLCYLHSTNNAQIRHYGELKDAVCLFVFCVFNFFFCVCVCQVQTLWRTQR